MACRAAGLSTEPSLTEFLRRLRSYLLVSPVVWRHCQRLSYYLGRRPDWYDRLFDLSELRALKSYAEERTGRTANLPFANRSARRGVEVTVTDADRHMIRDFYGEDVALYGRLFPTAA